LKKIEAQARLKQKERKTMDNTKSILQKTLDSIFGETYAARMPGEDEIREKAYTLWEEAGRPEGDGLEFWVKAERELAAS